jgi:predicted phosphohydrolase
MCTAAVTTKGAAPPDLNIPSSRRAGNTPVRLVFMGDTHDHHRDVQVPDGDILIHVGDLTMFSRDLAVIEDFDDWLGEQPHEHKIVVPGNHEFFLEADPGRRSLLGNAHVLINDSVVLCGLRFWGSPTTPLHAVAFGRSSARDRQQIWSSIPKDLDVLITHGPPHSILDTTTRNQEAIGDPELRAAVFEKKPLVHAGNSVLRAPPF